MDDPKAIVVGISGCSSSGKTTLARILRDIFPNTMILHEDDFYKAETELPTRHGFLDWDCAEAISVPDMEAALDHIRATGTFPASLDSKEDQNSVGKCPVSDAKIDAMKAKVAAWVQPGQPGHALFVERKLRLCLFDGFLMYSAETAGAMKRMDIKLFLLVSREKATQRREARDGYVTLEGFWKDPPGYVEKIVWPNYAKEHAWLFENGDVEGVPDEEVLEKAGISVQTGLGLDVDMETTLEWAVDLIVRELEKKVQAPL
ncbi:related to M.pneumoniae uridine kinase udk [Cephalotrichum gorgonifer]|uniref:Related to M.pneumoniae uridine kinase udk n=1 Tax=Cephalotrichum gorgonifer TaxID=2041049 RepID=A0AAE8N3U1_9PEZI|nr:related to M.pneumoniae uridine kinase udk [Cephalotrichum gorgonifer]